MRVRSTSLVVTLSFLLAFTLALATCAYAAHGSPNKDKAGILLVAFGTSYPEALGAYQAFEAEAAAAFPGVPLRWAWTSSTIRHKLAGSEHPAPPSPAGALAAMLEEGFTRVAIQPLHVIPGVEYHELMGQARALAGMPGGFQAMELGLPLLSDTADLMQAADLLAQEAADDGEALVLMGHGTHHPANAFYPALQYYLWRAGAPVLVGTVEGSPDLDDVLAGLRERKAKTVRLVPLMAVAGDHARNDMAGEEPGSWLTLLRAQGFEVQPELRGLAERPGFRAIWLAHLKDAWQRLQAADVTETAHP